MVELSTVAHEPTLPLDYSGLTGSYERDLWTMPFRYAELPLSKLLLDQSNARLGEEQPSQEAAQLALAALLDDELLAIAGDILDKGTDPTSLTAVTREKAPKGTYRVIEGNRRLLALRVLTTPGIVDAALTSGKRKRLLKYAESFSVAPITKIMCVVFDEEREARHWIELRHTGANGGVGLVEWDANEKDRYRARQGGLKARSAAGQILDFVDQVDTSDGAGNKRSYSTLQRLIKTPKVRETLGIDVERDVVYSYYPLDEVAKGLTAIVNDLRSGRTKVTHVYYENERIDYIRKLPLESRPDPATRLAARVELIALLDPSFSPVLPAPYSQDSLPLDETTGGQNEAGDASVGAARNSTGAAPAQAQVQGAAPAQAQAQGAAPAQAQAQGAAPAQAQAQGAAPAQAQAQGAAPALPTNPGVTGAPEQGTERTLRKSRAKEPKPRPTTIPRSCILWIPRPARINEIYYELAKLNVDEYPNACSVLLRVFVELSVDHHIARLSVLSAEERKSAKLSKKLKDLASRLKSDGSIDPQLEKAVIKIADGGGLFSASTVTFNQYVHNQFAYPLPSELRIAWDELQPFMQALWGR
ncbi:hypothetical protein [Micromonospora sp. MW-13]|uniref:hypothetical protein n=1 Tax=Micromonospora sp. MW-13 TaxID=2094022 RepID=UPI001404F64B|nr:hypothetical protein [Micromonospora sp. MW-13]